MIPIEKASTYKPSHGQAHCLVTQADTQPKTVKELAFPIHGQIGIKHETLTTYIKHLEESANFKGSTFNKHRNSLIEIALKCQTFTSIGPK